MADPVNWLDPCARATVLRETYFSLVKGGAPQRVRFQDREVWFSATKIDLLRAELRQAEAECAAATGGTAGRRRFAIRAGSRRI